MARVLIADDSAFARRLCGAILEAAGHSVLEACDGEEAVAAYQRERADVVLLDFTMPAMDGLEALHEIVRFDAEARIAMITAVGEPHFAQEALRAGARDFLCKPVRSARLLAVVDRLLL